MFFYAYAFDADAVRSFRDFRYIRASYIGETSFPFTGLVAFISAFNEAAIRSEQQAGDTRPSVDRGFERFVTAKVAHPEATDVWSDCIARSRASEKEALALCRRLIDDWMTGAATRPRLALAGIVERLMEEQSRQTRLGDLFLKAPFTTLRAHAAGRDWGQVSRLPHAKPVRLSLPADFANQLSVWLCREGAEWYEIVLDAVGSEERAAEATFDLLERYASGR